MTAYCTVAEVKDQGRLNVTTEEYDISLYSLVEAASRWIDRHVGVYADGFAVTGDTTIYLNSDHIRGRLLRLRRPCLGLTTVLNGGGTSIPLNAMRLQPRNEEAQWQIELFSAYSWSCATDEEIVVTGRFGYSETPPAEVAEASRMLTSWMFKRYQTALQEATANYDLGEVAYSDAMPKVVTALIEPIKIKIAHWESYS